MGGQRAPLVIRHRIFEGGGLDPSVQGGPVESAGRSFELPKRSFLLNKRPLANKPALDLLIFLFGEVADRVGRQVG